MAKYQAYNPHEFMKVRIFQGDYFWGNALLPMTIEIGDEVLDNDNFVGLITKIDKSNNTVYVQR